MIDVKQPLRKAYYDLLNGTLVNGGNPVPISDDVKKLSDSSTVYVILSNQSGTDSSTFQTFDSDETIVLDIVFKSGARVNKDVVDGIAGQIVSAVLPVPGYNGLITDPGIQVNCVRKTDDRYLTLSLNSSNSVTRRLITFSQHVRQTGLSGPPPTPVPPFSNPVVSADFATATGYIHPGLRSRSFNLFFNSVPRFLDYGTEWIYDTVNGGFIILLPNFDATLNSYVFYVLLN